MTGQDGGVFVIPPLLFAIIIFMQIYYGFALYRVVEFSQKYKKVLSLIKTKGDFISRDWLDDALQREQNKVPHPSRARLYHSIFSSITDSDICLFDSTAKSMGVGQQIMHALQNRKPTLVLSDLRHEGSVVNRLLISGNKSHYLTLRDYSSDEEMLRHVEEFIEKHRNARDQRMTLSIENNVFDTLQDEAFRKRVPLRDIIEERLDVYRDSLIH